MAAYGWITIDDSRGRRGNGAFVEVGQRREIPSRADVLYPQSSVWIFSVSARGSIDNSRDHSKSAGYTLKLGRKPAPSTMRMTVVSTLLPNARTLLHPQLAIGDRGKLGRPRSGHHSSA